MAALRGIAAVVHQHCQLCQSGEAPLSLTCHPSPGSCVSRAVHTAQDACSGHYPCGGPCWACLATTGPAHLAVRLLPAAVLCLKVSRVGQVVAIGCASPDSHATSAQQNWLPNGLMAAAHRSSPRPQLATLRASQTPSTMTLPACLVDESLEGTISLPASDIGPPSCSLVLETPGAPADMPNPSSTAPNSSHSRDSTQVP